MNRVLTLIPRYGLGNRLMAIAAALRLQDRGHFDEIRLCWEPASDLDVSYNDIIDINGITVIDRAINDTIFVNYVGLPRQARVPLANHVTVEAFDAFTVQGDDIVIDQSITSLGRVRFKANYYELADKMNVHGRVGLHCRRSDYPFSRPILSPDKLTAYHDFLDREFVKAIVTFPGPYFLASDSARTTDMLSRHLPGAVYAPKHYYPVWATRPRKTVDEGIVDMILLSRCRQIVADSPSTFSTVAAWFGDLDKMIWLRPNIKD